VWLYAPPDVLAARVGGGASRPLLGGDGASALTTLTRIARLREDTYRSAAHATVDASRDVAAVAGDIVEQYGMARQ
jgi:shikimate kinase